MVGKSLLFFFSLIHVYSSLVHASTPGKIKLYDDWNCNVPSTISPTVSLPLSVCLVTPGGGGLIIADYPPCSQGNASLISYSDPACGTSTTNDAPGIIAANCLELEAGQGIYNAKSVMFSCQASEDNPQPTSTSTAIVSAVAGVATGSASDNGAANSADTPAATSTAPSSPTGSSAPKSSNGATNVGGSTSTTNNTSTTVKSGSSSGLGSSNIIALAVGLGIGIPTIAIMLAAWLLPNFRYYLVACCCGQRKSDQLRQRHERHRPQPRQELPATEYIHEQPKHSYR